MAVPSNGADHARHAQRAIIFPMTCEARGEADVVPAGDGQAIESAGRRGKPVGLACRYCDSGHFRVIYARRGEAADDDGQRWSIIHGAVTGE